MSDHPWPSALPVLPLAGLYWREGKRPPLLLVLLLLLVSFISFAQAAPLSLEHDQRSFPLAGRLAVLPEPASTLDLTGALAADRAGRFTDLPDNLSTGAGHTATWLRFRPQRPPATTADWWLEVLPTRLDSTLYMPQGDGYRLMRLHDGDDTGQRFNAFHLQVPPGESTFYWRIDSDSPVSLKPILWQGPAFVQHVRQESMVQGMFFGILLLALGFDLTFWIWLRDRRYRPYCAYLSALVLSFAAFDGWLSPYLHRPTVTGSLLMAAATTWYCATFIKLAPDFPRTQRIFRGMAILTLIAAITTQFGAKPYLTQALLLINNLLILLGGPVLYRRWRLRVRETRHPGVLLHIAAFAAFGSGALLMNLRNIGVLPPGMMTDHALLAGTALHLFILHLALAQHLRAAAQEQWQRHAEALASARQAKQVLEQKASQRTAELSASNLAVQQNWQALQQARKEAEEMAATAQRLHEEERHLLELIAHEFRSPLAIIGNTAQTLRRIKESELDQVRLKGERIFSAVTRLASVIDNCLSDARLNSLDRPAQPQLLELAEIIGRAGALTQQDMVHRWQIDLPPKPLRIMADPVLLELALSNLIDNASKYAPPGTAIELFTAFDSEQVSISIRDHGPGIPTDMQADIFKKFIRYPLNHPGKSPPGAGLGLYLVKRIAMLHGGDIRLTSRPSEGACFTLSLPIPPLPTPSPA